MRSAGKATLLEEMPEACKDVSRVVDVVQGAGLSRKVAQHRLLAVVKGQGPWVARLTAISSPA